VVIRENNLESWWKRFNFQHHSPSGASRPTCLEIFEKAIARPAKMYSPPGCAMKAGTACHEYVERVLVNGDDPANAMRHAISILDEHKVQQHYPEDQTKFDIIRNGQYKSDISEQEDLVINLTLEHLLLGAREAVKGENKVEGGQWCSVEMEGLQLPYIGQMDIKTRSVVELKTQWPYVDSSGKSKRGFKINSLPAKPKADHIAQVALYWKWMRRQSENVKIFLVYANCKSYRVFSSDDSEELSEPRLNDALDRLRIVARTREAMMERSSSIKELLELVPPDFSHWMWRDKTPEFKQMAEKSWQ